MATRSLKDDLPEKEGTNIWTILLDFQTDPPSLLKDTGGQVGPRKYLYVNLNQVVERVVHERLVKAGCVVIQPLSGKQLLTIVRHVASGTELKSVVDLHFGDGPQDLGKAITYMRRYSLVALLGLLAEDDDDAAGYTPVIRSRPGATMGVESLVDDGNAASIFGGAL
jgi:hypothetical protein